ncbi:MAG: hypothetical protein CMF80_07200 [Candidatus Marinimicrobia bacterium]|nr:hypothetical protein [Candidatus Neomarinimicrobiota bacterium]|tara:strand:- start:236 stop:1108 length:873 start_codon:yes stop_codon:yes gene_type:complete
MSKNIIMGIYDYSNAPIKSYKGGIYAFLKSLRIHNKDCEVVLICNKKNESTALMNCLKEYNAYTYNYDPKDIEHDCGNKSREFKLYCRFKFISDFLENKYYDNILLCDMNDIVFQDDPFTIEYETEIYCSCELHHFGGDKIGKPDRHTKMNIDWMIPYYNEEYEEIRKKFLNQFIVCAGTILGTQAGIQKFLDWYIHVQIEHNYLINDQGLYNIYIHEVCDSKHLDWYRHSKFLAIDHHKLDKYDQDEDGFILNDKGDKYVLIHMYGSFGYGYREGLEYIKDLTCEKFSK